MEKKLYIVEDVNEHIPFTWDENEYGNYYIPAVFDSKEKAKETLKSAVSYAVVIKETEDWVKVINPDTDEIEEFQLIEIPLNPTEYMGF